MARTSEGRRLTEEHKLAQIRLGSIAAALTLENAKRLDVNDLDGTRERWALAQQAIIVTLRRRSQVLAEDYLRDFWEAEGVAPRDIVTPDLPDPREAVEWVVPVIKARTAKYANAG